MLKILILSALFGAAAAILAVTNGILDVFPSVLMKFVFGLVAVIITVAGFFGRLFYLAVRKGRVP